jgi:CTP synthase
VVGKYIELQDAYKSVYEALIHGGIANDCGVQIEQIEAESVESGDPAKIFKGLGGLLVPGGFGDRGIEGKIRAARFARENGLPYLGLCLGMQIAVIEYGRNVLGLDGAHSTEFNPNTPHPVIDIQEGQKTVVQKGGTMRLGSQACRLEPGSRTAALYGTCLIHERHRHRFEFNNEYRKRFADAGFIFAGTTPDDRLVEVIEIPNHPFFIASQYHPEFLSKPNAPHPLFRGFIAAAHQRLHSKPLLPVVTPAHPSSG